MGNRCARMVAGWEPHVSGDGRFVAFTSEAATLVPEDTNGMRDVFVKDLADGSVERVSVDGDGHQLASHSYIRSISADGRYVLFLAMELVETGATPSSPRPPASSPATSTCATWRSAVPPS